MHPIRIIGAAVVLVAFILGVIIFCNILKEDAEGIVPKPEEDKSLDNLFSLFMLSLFGWMIYLLGCDAEKGDKK